MATYNDHRSQRRHDKLYKRPLVARLPRHGMEASPFNLLGVAGLTKKPGMGPLSKMHLSGWCKWMVKRACKRAS